MITMIQKIALVLSLAATVSCIQQKEREPEKLDVPEVPVAQAKSAAATQTKQQPQQTRTSETQDRPVQNVASDRFGYDDVDLDNIDRGMNPKSPSQKLLKSANPIGHRTLNVEHMQNAEGRTQRVFLKNGKRFNGWTVDVNMQIDVRTKYFKYVDGLVEWQVGFFDTGELTIDQRKKDGLNYGHNRFWNKKGEVYINGFYSEPGKAHGPQKSWFVDGSLARDGLYEHGELIYDVMFDESGKIIEQHGTLPKKYQ